MKGPFAYLLGAALVILFMLPGCAPSLSPLYRDFDTGRSDSTAVDSRIVAALQGAGWDTVATEIPNAIATQEKVLSNWGLYKVTASLEITPLGPDHVRVFIHPYRKYVIGGKGKIPFLTRRIRSQFLPELNDSFEDHGFVLVGTPFERDDTKMR